LPHVQLPHPEPLFRRGFVQTEEAEGSKPGAGKVHFLSRRYREVETLRRPKEVLLQPKAVIAWSNLKHAHLIRPKLASLNAVDDDVEVSRVSYERSGSVDTNDASLRHAFKVPVGGIAGCKNDPSRAGNFPGWWVDSRK
jgi:hypothetical protein